MAIRKEEMAQITCVAMKQRGKSVEDIIATLEAEFGDNFAQLQRGDSVEICWVYEDSRPNFRLCSIKKKG